MISIKKKFDLFNGRNVVSLNRSEILRNSIPKKDLVLAIEKIQSGIKIVDSDILKLFFYMLNNKGLETNFLNGNFYYDDIVYINDDTLDLPAYYNETEKVFICNFSKPIFYLTQNDIIAYILYTYVYKYQFKLKEISKNLVKYIGDIFSTAFLFNFGNKEGLLSDLKSLFYLRIITYKFVYKFLFNKDKKLIDFVYMVDNKLKIVTNVNKLEIENIDKMLNVSSIKEYLITLSKLDLSPNTDVKSFVSTLYRKYGINPIVMFECADRILPFLFILNFENIINNNFSIIVRKDSNKAIMNYCIRLVMKNL